MARVTKVFKTEDFGQGDYGGLGMEVPVYVSLFPINLVGKGTIRKSGKESIQKRKRILLLDFHGELDMGRDTIKMMEERGQRWITMRPNNESIVDKSNPTFRL
jgi:hypothetical protein